MTKGALKILILISGGLNCKQFVQLPVYCLYFVWYPDDGSRSDRNMSVNANIW